MTEQHGNHPSWTAPEEHYFDDFFYYTIDGRTSIERRLDELKERLDRIITLLKGEE